MDLEGFDRVAIVGSDENHGGVVADQFEDFEAVQLGHLNIEEHQIGLLLGDGFNGFEAVGAFGDEFDFWMAGHELSQDLAGELLVVNDDGADFFGGFAGHDGCVSLSAGSVKATR